MKFSIEDFPSFLRIWSQLLKIFLMENFIFCAVYAKPNNARLPLYTHVCFQATPSPTYDTYLFFFVNHPSTTTSLIMLITPFYKRVTKHYANRKTIEAQQKKCCFLCFIYNFYKKNARNFLQLICTRSGIFQLRSYGIQCTQKFSDVSCSRFPTAFRSPEKEADISYQCATRLKKTTEWVVRFFLLLGYHLIHISFLQYKSSIFDVIIVFEIDQKH